MAAVNISNKLKIIYIVSLLAFVALILLAANYLSPSKNSADVNAKLDDYSTLSYRFLGHENAPFNVWLADTPEKQQQGLSGVKKLEENQGMLFIFEDKRNLTFWMKGMTIPIDIIWIDGNKVTKIFENILPEPGVSEDQLELYSPGEPLDTVLEMPAGWSTRQGIKEGDHLSQIVE